MAELVFSGTVQTGQFKPDDPVGFAGRLARLEGRRVRASFRREDTGRTMSQNRYYWAVVMGTLSEWSGYEPEEFHDLMKEKFLAPRDAELPDGSVERVYPSTRVLGVEEFSAYVERIARWAAEKGCYIPEAERHA